MARKTKKISELLWLFGILFVSLGVCLCNKADLGVSMIAAPSFIVAEALSVVCPFFSVGVTEYVLQGVLLILMCAIMRKFHWIYLTSFIVAVLYGYTINLFLFLLKDVVITAVYLRWLVLLVGIFLIGFGVACFFRTYLPLQVYELFVAEISKRFSLKLSKVKLVFDFSLLALSLILVFTLFGDANSFDWSSIYYHSYHNVGLGTLVITVLNSPVISLCGKVIDKFFVPVPAFNKLCKFLEIKY